MASSNQPPPLEPYDPFSSDRALVEAVEREGAGWAAERLRALGRVVGSEAIEWGFQANAHPPVLRTHDRFGERIDEVEFHPAWHRLLGLALANEVHGLPWREPRAGAHVARAAAFFVLTQAEAGVGCPLSMTCAAVPALRVEPELAAEWEPRLLSTEYDPRPLPAAEKRGALCGMAMTEKQGGSDVRANQTRAVPVSGRGPGAAYELTGHKWFCSAPMSDAFLVLAQADGGLSCFLLPRWLEGGIRNGFEIQRLKDKLGNRANASSEIELRRARARLVGPEGRGVATIVEMVNHTRLDCVTGSAALMRQAVAQAVHHASHRSAFGRLLKDQPLMRSVLLDLCVESEAATVTAMRLARAYDEATLDPRRRLLARILTAVSKFWVCKRVPGVVAEALECLGGNGYVEESVMPRLYREAPLNSVWEGSGNVICLDVLRVLRSEPAAMDVFMEEAALGSGLDPRLDARVASLRAAPGEPDLEAAARRLTEDMALVLQGSLMVRHAPAGMAEAFCLSRLGPERALAFGARPAGAGAAAVLERARPAGPR